jgi:hypothetical protein
VAHNHENPGSTPGPATNTMDDQWVQRASVRKPETRGDRIIRFCQEYLIVPEGAQGGKPMVLREWQRDIIRGIYDTPTRRAIISFGRKNGKTALTAMLVLAHLVGPEARRNSQIYSAAQSRDQAALVFSPAAKMARMSAILNDAVTVRDSAKELFCARTGVRCKALSADATTAYGLSPVLSYMMSWGRSAVRAVSSMTLWKRLWELRPNLFRSSSPRKRPPTRTSSQR